MNLWRVLGGIAVLATLICTGWLLPVRAQDKDKGEVKFVFKAFGPKEAPFYQKLVTNTTQLMKVEKQGQPELKQVQDQTFVIKYTPKEEKGNDYVVDQKIEYVDMNIQIGTTKIAYNSIKDKEVKNPMTEFFDALMNVTLTLHIDKTTLKVSKVDGRKEFVDKLGQSHPQMKGLLNSILSEDALKQMAAQTWGAIPLKGVKKGESWTPPEIDLNLGPIGTYKNKYAYTYEGLDEKEKLEKISVVPSMTYVAPKTTGSADEKLPFEIKGDSTLKSEPGPDTTGTVYLDPEKGRIAKSSMKMKVAGIVVIAIGGTDTRVELTQTQTSNLTTADRLEDSVPAKSK